MVADNLHTRLSERRDITAEVRGPEGVDRFPGCACRHRCPPSIFRTHAPAQRLRFSERSAMLSATVKYAAALSTSAAPDNVIRPTRSPKNAKPNQDARTTATSEINPPSAT